MDGRKMGGEKIAALLPVRWRSDRAVSAPVPGRINPGTACSDRTGIQSLYRRR